ncbi:aminotransferase class IV family protein [Actinoalloteichus fjordicus]|nr:aminotransferase class IV family protein [Actinoalloteichus fjordicus]
MTELNGAPADLDQVKALALSNYGHFTSMRVEDNRVRGLSLHLDRLRRDCRVVFDAELDPDRVRTLVRKAVADWTEAVVVRVTVFDPSLELGHPGAAAEPQVLVTTRPAVAQPLPPIRVQAVQYQRELPAVKHVGLFGLVHQRRAAQRAGYDDVVFTNRKAQLCEGATWNIGFFDGENIVWPDADALPGVTMALLNEVHNGDVDTASIDLAQLCEMKVAFATNAAIGVRQISAVDDTEWPDTHPILDVLRKEYTDIAAEPL